jgi:dTDP-glucose 4,6-dehydratase
MLLVTGGAGFIGGNFVHHWLEHHPGDRVIVLDALTYSGNLATLEPLRGRPELRFVQGSICDVELLQRLLRQERIDTIVHFAAESHVDRSITGPDVFVQTNVVGTHCLLRAARQVWLQEQSTPKHRFHHVSTDEVYGSLEPNDPAFTETTRYAPNSPYAASKAASDHLVRAYVRTYGLCATISNCSNNYGPYHFPEKLIPLTIVNILRGKSLPVYGDGLNVRDWLFVGDHCAAIREVLERGRLGETYNVGGTSEQTNGERKNIDVVTTICDILDELRPDAKLGSRRGLITYVKDRPGHDRRYAINAEKITRELGWRPEKQFESGIRETVEWFLANMDWVNDVRSGHYKEWIDLNYSDRLSTEAASGRAR